MAKRKATPPLEQNPYVKELLALLKKHKSPGRAELLAMLANAARIEQQLAEALLELAAMRRELIIIREENHPFRTALQNTINALQERIEALREQLETLKAAIIEGCKNALAAFKERGAEALDGIAKFFKLRPALEKLSEACEKSEQDNNRAIDKIETISAEYHKAGQALRNIGRAAMGKEPLTEAKAVGKVAKAVEAPFKAVRACSRAAWVQAQGALENLAKLEKTADRPKPIKEQYDTAAKQAAAHNALNTQDRAKPAPAHEGR